jgi:hypothetical protein
MANFYKYAIVRLAPDDARDERINIGVVVFADTGLRMLALLTSAHVAMRFRGLGRYPSRNWEHLRPTTLARTTQELRR